MPTTTRGIAQTRSRNRYSDAPTIEISEVPSQDADEGPLIDHEMEDDEQGGDEDEEVMGTLF